MPTVTISSKGQIVIPSEVRHRYGLDPGKKVEILDFGGQIVLVPLPDDPVKAAKGMVKLRRSVSDILSEARKEEAELEEKKWEMLRGAHNE